MMGITCKNKAKWATRTYETSNLVVANGVLGKAFLSVGQWLKPPATDPEEVPDLGAIRYLSTVSTGAAPVLGDSFCPLG